MPAGTPDEWLFEDWQLIARAFTATTHEDCRSYDCETIDEQSVPVGNQERLAFVLNRERTDRAIAEIRVRTDVHRRECTAN